MSIKRFIKRIYLNIRYYKEFQRCNDLIGYMRNDPHWHECLDKFYYDDGNSRG